MKKIVGIMGGTFNPIHKGHVRIAQCAHEQFNIPEILVMPSGDPAYKDTSNVVAGIHRCNMVNLAIKSYPYMSMSDIEVKRQGRTYTADTLEILKVDYDYIYFIMGADSLFYLQEWYKPEYICSHCHILCANRDEHLSDELQQQRDMLIKNFDAKIDFIKCENLPFSSTKVRENIKNKLPVEDIIGADVYKYILDNNLYC